MAEQPHRHAWSPLAHRLADLAGAAILPHFRTNGRVDNKHAGGFDPVTEADRDAERAIADELRLSAPAHGLIGEEFGSTGADARLKWVIDPIDGTRAFIMGFPLWGTLIGLLDGEEPVIGIMDQPFTGERFSAEKGGPAVLRRHGTGESKLRTRSCASLGEATFATTHPDLFAPGLEAAAFSRIKAGARMTRYGGDCYAYAMLASGHVDLIVEAGLKLYDIVALIPIIEAAGGCITTWDGAPATSGGRIVASGDRRLHDEALRLLAG